MKKSSIHCISDRFYLYRLSRFRRNLVYNKRETRGFVPLYQNHNPKRSPDVFKAVAQGSRDWPSSQKIHSLEALWQQKILQHCWLQLWTSFPNHHPEVKWFPHQQYHKRVETASGFSLPKKGSRKDSSGLVEEPHIKLVFRALSSTVPCPSNASPISQRNGKLTKTKMPQHHKSTFSLCTSEESGCYFKQRNACKFYKHVFPKQFILWRGMKS